MLKLIKLSIYRLLMMTKLIHLIPKLDTSCSQQCMFKTILEFFVSYNMVTMYISLRLLYIFKRFSNLFAINNETGKITVQKKAPTSAGVIELVVLAQDLGIPPLQSSAHILVSLHI